MDQRIIYRLFQAQHRMERLLRERLAETGSELSPAQSGILFALLIEDGRSMTELSAELDLDNSAVTGLVDRLTKAGLVERRSNAGDRRRYDIYLTKAGRKAAEKAERIVQELNTEILHSIPPAERGKVLKFLDNVARPVEQSNN